MNMIPQVAQHPRFLSQQFGSPGFAAPQYEPLPLPSPRRLDQHAPEPSPLPFRGLRGFPPPAPSQSQPPRAYPFALENHAPRRTVLARGSSSEQGFRSGSQYNDPAEHMLRRKTPNGTLAAGYDGTPVEWSSKAPALKHMVLPLSGSLASRSELYYSPAVSNNQQSRQRSRTLGWDYQRGGQYAGNNGGEGEQRMVGEGGNWTSIPPMPDTSQNVWDHLEVPQIAPAPSYYQHNGTQIPTVLQPAWQPSPGPTASNDAGFYGPYWPDGKFVPYRPAAFRGQENHYPTRDSYSDRAAPSQNQSHAELIAPFGQSSTNRELDPTLPAGNYWFSFQDSRLDQRFQAPTQLQPLHIDSSYYSSPSEGSRTPTAESVSRGSNHRFKEKTLSWAHSIYVNVLAYRQQTKKDNRNSAHAHGSSSFSKTSIYPKPPRQHASYLASSQWAGLNTVTYEGASQGHAGAMPRPTHKSRASSDYNWQNGNKEARIPRTSSTDMRHYMSPFQVSHFPTANSLSKAKEALELLTNLCEQSGWCWIDGMLLGGCLAYILDQYHDALDWYTKIIALEPKHVEAISNLAATLHSLNRREEAEQHWLQSVKLRPSYFEAVEHLIGLLCGDQRGPEAIGIIDFVERSLRLPKPDESQDYFSETSSNADRESSESVGTISDTTAYDYEINGENTLRSPSIRDNGDSFTQPGFGSSGFSIPGSENGRILALVHAKGNMLYVLGDVNGAAKAFEDAVLISAGRALPSIQGLIRRIVNVLSEDGLAAPRLDFRSPPLTDDSSPLLLPPDKALQTARLVFAKDGELPGLRHVPEGLARKAAVSTTSNCLLSLAKIFQDAMSNSTSPHRITRMPTLLAVDGLGERDNER